MDTEKKKSAPPKLHKFMHPRNPYKTIPSFKKLAQTYAGFRAYCMYEVDGKVRLDFKNPKAVRELTTCLLDQDFGLKVDIPEGRLVPTLPLRFNYLLWIEDLLTLLSNRSKSKDTVVGVDIGCGASCIYPLLAAKQNNWCMVATEVDDLNFESATKNVQTNQFQNQVVIRKVEQNVVLKTVLDDAEMVAITNTFRKTQSTDNTQLSGEEKEGDSAVKTPVRNDDYLFDFTMCNPPFFGSIEETDSMSKSRKERTEPSSAPTGAVHETTTEGGEVAFIIQMMEESVLLKDRVRIFTTMIGSKVHVKEIKNKLKALNPAHSAVVEFCQGRTMRWGLAWTFDPSLHLENVMSKKQMVDAKPLVLMLPRSMMTVYTVSAAWTLINKWLHQLKITVQIFKKTKYFVGANVKAYKPTWLHQRRKKRENHKKETKQDEDNIMNDEVTIDESNILKRKDSESKLQNSESKRQKIVQETEDPITARSMEDNNGQLPSVDDSSTEDSQKQGTGTKEPNGKWLATHAESVNTEGNAENPQEEQEEANAGGLECILKAKLQLKQCGGLISLEALYLRGSSGKDGLNQIFQYMRNQLAHPTS